MLRRVVEPLDFEGEKVTRVGAFDLLTRMDEPERRKKLFLQFVPLWQSINGKSERDSPYRRVIAMAAERGRTEGTEIDAAAKTVGASTAEVENWLVQILDAWRKASDGKPMEPWDYRYRGGATERELGETIAREALQPINERLLSRSRRAARRVERDLRSRSAAGQSAARVHRLREARPHRATASGIRRSRESRATTRAAVSASSTSSCTRTGTSCT